MNTTADGILIHSPRREHTTAPVEFQPRVEAICPYCGAKHGGPFLACQSCRDAANKGL